MKLVIALLFTGLSFNAVAAQPRLDLPSCDIAQQRALNAETGGSIKDPGQARIAQRANTLVADIGTLRKARQLTEKRAQQMMARIDEVRTQTDGFVKQQGFLSAGEEASFQREFDSIASQLCRSAPIAH